MAKVKIFDSENNSFLYGYGFCDSPGIEKLILKHCTIEELAYYQRATAKYSGRKSKTYLWHSIENETRFLSIRVVITPHWENPRELDFKFTKKRRWWHGKGD